MRKVEKIFALVLIAFMPAVGQTQVGTASSDTSFQLRGAKVTTGQGVPSWPVMPGDILKAADTPVTITFPDGSVITLSPGSSGKVDLSGQIPVFQLLNGSAHYQLTNLSAVKLMTGADPFPTKDLVGDLFLGGKKPPAGWWTAGHTALVVGGAGGATALGVALATKKPPKVSCGGQNQQGNNNCQ